MAGLVGSVANDILNGYFGDTQYTTPNNLYLALYSAEPMAGGNEVDYTGYDRIALQGQMSDASNGYVLNVNQLTFGENQDSDSVTISHFGICTNDTKGDDNSIVFVGELIDNITLEQNYAVVFDSGTIKVIIN